MWDVLRSVHRGARGHVDRTDIQPVALDICGHVFCGSCITLWLKVSAFAQLSFPCRAPSAESVPSDPLRPPVSHVPWFPSSCHADQRHAAPSTSESRPIKCICPSATVTLTCV
jgi:hypothetical protein